MKNKTPEEMYLEVSCGNEFVYPDTLYMIYILMDKYADQFKPKWISVETLLPCDSIAVLIYNGNYKRIAFLSDGINLNETMKPRIWYDNITGATLEWQPTHWMYLPKNP